MQYTALYCNLGARQDWIVLQYSAQPSHNTATVATTRRWAGAQVLGWGAGRAGWALGVLALGAGRAGSGRWACWRAGRARGAGGWARRALAGSGTARALQATGVRACGAGGGRRAGRARGCAAGVRGAGGVRCRRGAGAGRATGGVQALGARGARGKRTAWALGMRPGRAGWPWAVHSVHSAYFRSVLTRYCS